MKGNSPTAVAMRRPITVIMLIITVLSLGVIAYTRIPIEFLPKMDFPFIGVFIPYPGATPEQVEKEVAIPAEGEFRTLSNLERITTDSDMDGCFVRMMFTWDADMSVATAEVRDRMERLKLQLPSEIERLFIRRWSANTMPVMAMAVLRESNEEELAHLCKTVLQSRLLRIDGVADVTIFTKSETDVLVQFDQNRLRSSGLSLYDLVSRLQSSSINMSLGELEEGQTKYLVRVLGEFDTPDEIGDLVVGPAGTRLKEVADVGYNARERDSDYSIDGKGGAFVMVRKESEANTVATCEAVEAELARVMREPGFRDAETFMFFDQSKLIRASLDGLMAAGEFGGALAVIVLFLFLWRVRPTLVVALSIPASVVVALVAMFFLGITLNIVTMTALIVALGMLVDNAIVVMENIVRYNQMGLSREESAYRGASEVAMAITAATLTTIVVFIPIFYINTGEMATYMSQFGLPVTVALLASLAIALTVIPLAATHMKPWGVENGSGARKRRWFARIRPLEATINAYVWLLDRVMHWRLATVGLTLIIVFVTAVVAGKSLGQRGMPDFDSRQVEMSLVFDQNLDMAAIGDTVKQLEDTINQWRDELGIKHLFLNYGPGNGSIDVHLLKPEDLAEDEVAPYTTKEVMDILWQRIPARLPGAEVRFSIAEASESSGMQVSIRMRGDDAATLTGYAEQFKTLMATLPNVSDVETDSGRTKQEVQLQVDETLSQQAGISAFMVARVVDFALRGVRLPYLKQGGREIPVWAQFQEEDRKSRSNLENVTVLGGTGELVPVSRLVQFGKATSPQSITRENGKNVINISAKVGTKDLSEVKAPIEALIDSFELPRGYTIEMGQELEELQENMQNFATAAILAVILVFIVMGALFESYILPLSILTSVPCSVIGVVWLMYLTDTPMDTIAFIGIILMLGIVVNNGIVIIDHINQLRLRGAERLDAILQAGRDRFRPVMMTALTTILGCVPLAIGGTSAGDVSLFSLGRALIGGLSTGTLLTLLIVPLTYSLIDDLRVWFSHYMADLRSLGRAKAPADAP